MKPYNNMKPEELEVIINDAADGLLSRDERKELEKTLETHPELLQDYRSIMKLPDMKNIYGKAASYSNPQQAHNILHLLDKEDEKTTFYNTTVVWFRKYAIAASLLILALTSIFYVTQPELLNGDITFEEFYYPDEELESENYATYLDEWFEQ